MEKLARATVLIVLALGACERARSGAEVAHSVPPGTSAEPTAPPAPPPAQPPPTTDSPILDLCHPEPERLCVLHADGRVSCAKLELGRFEAPLEAITDAVEMSCAWGLVCTRTTSDELRCANEEGQRAALDLPGAVRSLDGNCLVDGSGALKCWDREWTLEPRSLPETPYGTYPELERVLFVGAAGCALGVDGQLWCWSAGDSSVGADLGLPDHVNEHTEERTYYPRPLTTISGQVEELQHRHNALCWRLSSGWECAMWDGKVGPAPTCESQPCDCRTTTRGLHCDPGELERAALREAELNGPGADELVGVLRHTRSCAVDVEGRVWCDSKGIRELQL